MRHRAASSTRRNASGFGTRLSKFGAGGEDDSVLKTTFAPQDAECDESQDDNDCCSNDTSNDGLRRARFRAS